MKGYVKGVIKHECTMIRIMLKKEQKGNVINSGNVLKNNMNYTMEIKMTNDGNYIFFIIIYAHKF